MSSQCLCPDGPTLFHNGASGDSTCMECGVVVSENALVSEVTFGETSGGAAMAHGTLVAEGATHARIGGGRRSGEGSSEQAIYNGRMRIAQVATAMSIPDTIRESALRFYKLAVAARFTKGRRSRLVVAACLYAACQHVQFGYMLIDFSDLLQINVFVLGATYLQLIKVLHMPRPYAIDPAHYIARFAALLEFGDETPKVAHDAARLVKRFKADWMNTGRRPAGICGACLLLAARMNNFRRSVQEIVQVVKIADQTLIKRLEEFKNTGSSGLTVSEFRDDEKWLPEEVEAPPIVKAQARKQERLLKRKRKRGEVDADGDEEDPTADADADADGERESVLGDGYDNGVSQPDPSASDPLASVPQPPPPDVPQINFSSGIFRGVGLSDEDIHPFIPSNGTYTIDVPKPLFLLDDPEEAEASKEDEAAQANTMFHPQRQDDIVIDPALLDASLNPHPPPDSKDDDATGEIAEEVEAVLHGTEGEQLAAELDEAQQTEKAKQTEPPEDKLDDLDEDELDQFILTEEEVRIKTRVWVEMNRDYLEKLAAKGLDEEEGAPSKKQSKPKKARQKPRDSTTARGATPAESVGHLLKKKKFSRKINYDAVKNLFKSGTIGGFDGYDDEEEKDDHEGLSTIDPDPMAEEEVVSRAGDAVSGYSASAAGDADESMYVQDDYYDDGGYEEEV